MKFLIKKILLLLFIINSSLFSFAVPGLYNYKLDNGLELFVVENDSAPLVYVEVAVRCGAVTQTADDAGLFHLYEHMMFKGNARYSNESETMAAMNALGVDDWNGTTGTDRVNYYFTIPSGLVRQGLEFWSYAIRTPLMDPQELENEKGVVLSEIKGNFTDPGRILSAGLNSRMYPDHPYKVDTGGTEKNISSCTVEKLRQIQSEYYVPDNAAVFVGGDVKHEEIYQMVKEIFGDWKKSGRNFYLGSVHSKTPSLKTQRLVYPNPKCAQVLTQVTFRLRGPDGETDAKDTYGADVWSFLLEDPSNVFVQNLVNEKALNIPDVNYAGGYYSTQRCTGFIGINVAMINDENSPVERAEKFHETLIKKCIPLCLDPESDFTKDMSKVLKKLEDNRIYSNETAEGIISGLSASWASSGFEYYENYEENLKKVTVKDVNDFAAKYLKDKPGIILVNVNPDVYARYKEEFAKAGYEEISAENAFWWKSGNR